MRLTFSTRRRAIVSVAVAVIGSGWLFQPTVHAQAATSTGTSTIQQWRTSSEATFATTLGQKQAHRLGIPAGLNYSIESPDGTMMANFGAGLSKVDQALLVSGASVTVTGLSERSGDDSLFLVREVTVGGRKLILRNPKGLPFRSGTVTMPSRLHSTQPSGGAQ